MTQNANRNSSMLLRIPGVFSNFIERQRMMNEKKSKPRRRICQNIYVRMYIEMEKKFIMHSVYIDV